MALLEDLKAQAASVGEEYPKSLTLRAAAEIKELRETLGIALATLEQTEELIRVSNRQQHKDIPKELHGYINRTEPMVWNAVKMAKDTLEFGL